MKYKKKVPSKKTLDRLFKKLTLIEVTKYDDGSCVYIFSLPGGGKAYYTFPSSDEISEYAYELEKYFASLSEEIEVWKI